MIPISTPYLGERASSKKQGLLSLEYAIEVKLIPVEMLQPREESFLFDLSELGEERDISFLRQ